MKAFQAHSKDGSRVTRSTPREAAMEFFDQFPGKRKCDITAGDSKDGFFTVTYTRGTMPETWKNVSKKMVTELPCELV